MSIQVQMLINRDEVAAILDVVSSLQPTRTPSPTMSSVFIQSRRGRAGIWAACGEAEYVAILSTPGDKHDFIFGVNTAKLRAVLQSLPDKCTSITIGATIEKEGQAFDVVDICAGTADQSSKSRHRLFTLPGDPERNGLAGWKKQGGPAKIKVSIADHVLTPVVKIGGSCSTRDAGKCSTNGVRIMLTDRKIAVESTDGVKFVQARASVQKAEGVEQSTFYMHMSVIGGILGFIGGEEDVVDISIHNGQIKFSILDDESGEVIRGLTVTELGASWPSLDQFLGTKDQRSFFETTPANFGATLGIIDRMADVARIVVNATDKMIHMSGLYGGNREVKAVGPNGESANASISATSVSPDADIEFWLSHGTLVTVVGVIAQFEPDAALKISYNSTNPKVLANVTIPCGVEVFVLCMRRNIDLVEPTPSATTTSRETTTRTA